MLRQIRNTALKTITTGVIVIGTVEVTTNLPSQGRSSELYHKLADEVATPLIRTVLNPEDAHNLAVYCVKNNLAPRYRPVSNSNKSRPSISLETKMTKNLIFPNCVGLAAGFDKDGVAIKGLMELGFGFVEIGSVTPMPQPGNPKPRMYRLTEDRGIINRFGFNSLGMNMVEGHLRNFRQEQEGVLRAGSGAEDESIKNLMDQAFGLLLTVLKKGWLLFCPKSSSHAYGVLGVNLGKNKTSIDETEDYEQGIRRLGPYADYLVINISSPNTPGLRNLQNSEPIRRLLRAAIRERNALPPHKPPTRNIIHDYASNTNDDESSFVNQRKGEDIPLFVKIAPDLTDEELKDIANAVMECKIDGILVTNTSSRRPETLLSKHAAETGGLSGRPIREMSTECIRKVYQYTSGNTCIIGVGGVENGHDAYEKLKAGASAIQIYSCMIYNGPGVVSRIRSQLIELMAQNGQRCMEDVVGLDHENIYWEKRQARVKALRAMENIIVDT